MRTTLLLALTLAAPGFLGAEDHFTFNDGRTIDGTYLGGTDQEVKILYGSTELIVPRSSVQRIDLAVKGDARPQAQPVVVQVPPVVQTVPATYTPPPQVVYVQQPAPVYVAPAPAVVWSVGIGSGWYGSRWDHHRPCYVVPYRTCGPTWSIGVQSWHGWR